MVGWLSQSVSQSEGESVCGKCAENHTGKQGAGRVASSLCRGADIVVSVKAAGRLHGRSEADRVDDVRFFRLDCAVVAGNSIGLVERSWISIDLSPELSELRRAQILDLL